MDRFKLGMPSGRTSSFTASPVDGHLEEAVLGPVEDASEAKGEFYCFISRELEVPLIFNGLQAFFRLIVSYYEE